MVGRVVAAMDQRVVAIDQGHLWIVFLERSDVRVVLPEPGARRSDIGQELAGVARVEVPHRCGEHDDIPRRLKILQNELSHGFFVPRRVSICKKVADRHRSESEVVNDPV
jgi:hypothetical protein